MSDLGAPSGSVLPADPPPSRGPDRRLLIGGGVAGAVVIAVVLGFLLRPHHPAGADGTPVAQTGTTTASAPGAPSATSQAGAVQGGIASGSATPSATASAGPASSAPAASVTPTNAPGKPAASYSPPPHVASVSRIGPMAATGIVTGKGIEVTGTVEQAVQWEDRNGRNVLLASRRIDHNRGDGGPDAGTIVVLLVSHLDGRAEVERTMTDSIGTPTRPCALDLGLGVVPGSLTVRDDDHDGVGEVTAAWWTSCSGDAGQVSTRLALLSGPKKYILRGSGLPKPEYTDAERRKLGVPPASFSASPGRSGWPANSYARVTALARQLFV